MEKTIAIGLDRKGDFTIITKEKTLPVEICEQVLNEVCKKVAATSKRHHNNELRAWQLLAIAQLIILVIVILRVKGVL